MLVGTKVTVRTVRKADLDRLYDLAADIRDMGARWRRSMVSEIRWGKSLSESGWWEGDEGTLIITDSGDDIVGQVSVFRASPYQNAKEIGFRIYRPEDWGKGYASEAVALVSSFVFDTQTIDRIQAAVMHGNVASETVLQKCGFKFEGVMRKAVFHRGENRDMRLYSLVRDECLPLGDILAPRSDQ